MLMRHASHPHEQQGRGPRGGGGNITAAAAISANLSHQGKQLLSSIDRSIDRWRASHQSTVFFPLIHTRPIMKYEFFNIQKVAQIWHLLSLWERRREKGNVWCHIKLGHNDLDQYSQI